MRDDHDRAMMEHHRSTPSGAQTSQSAQTWQQLPKSPVLDRHSRLFEAFMSRDQLLSSEASNPPPPSAGPTRISPSYLQGTEYMRKLNEQYERRKVQASKERDSSGGGLTTSRSNQSLRSGQMALPSHRGMTLAVVERLPPTTSSMQQDATDEVKPLPTRWMKDDKSPPGLEITGDGFDVKCTGSKSLPEKDYEACAVRADHPMPGQCGVYYFEITVLSAKSNDTAIIIAFGGKDVSLNRAPGWEPESWGYHSDDGNLFASASTGKAYGPKFGVGDTVGCLVNFRTATASFTHNGRDLGVAFRDNTFRQGKGKFYPIVGLKKPGDHIFANFGQLPFQFDIDGYVRAEQERIWDKIRQTDTSNLVPGLSEQDLCQQLVLQHLQHDGYLETAHAFAEEILSERKALRLDPNEPVKDINIRDDQDARQRQQIRRAVLEGNIDEALKLTNAYYPSVLEANPRVYFRLRCRKFVEIIRQHAEERVKEQPRAGINPVTKTIPAHDDEDMDVEHDRRGYEGNEWNERMEDDPPALGGFLERALEYGRGLRAEFANSADPEASKHLDEIFALIAYQNPLTEERVAHLLDQSGRVDVAEELNSAILRSCGKSSRSALETVFADTTVLLKSLREEGSFVEGAFVSIQDILAMI